MIQPKIITDVATQRPLIELTYFTHAHARGLPWDFPEVVGTVQQVHCSRGRLLRRGLGIPVCTINKSAHTKKSLGTYLMILVYWIFYKYPNTPFYLLPKLEFCSRYTNKILLGKLVNNSLFKNRLQRSQNSSYSCQRKKNTTENCFLFLFTFVLFCFS